ncbi:MotA/TolQ/ExbB proton channel family protein [Granulosicoccus sp.]|jgi:biopolymer transport protein ExbB|nr:MotA/TolQ/ExbB proton channel family protein [Granulosicoccus sp.]MDB4223877.1 MotA/TolQ/ExbB proton channel family protein [Granulosicoccus sp.]
MSFIVGLFEKGGLLVVPLLVLLVAGAVIIVYKAIQLRQSRIVSPAVVKELEQMVLARRTADATAYCKQNSTPMTRVLLAGILNYEKSESELKATLEEAGRQEIPSIRYWLPTLGTIASLAPLLGLLGTVVGMIEVFATLAQEENVNSTMLAGGISQALVTTAIGMVIAMPTLAAYNYFVAKVQTLTIEMERLSLRMVSILKRSRSA